MTRSSRWALVAVAVLLVVGVPVGLRAVPPGDSDVSAAELLSLVEGSAEQPWSGYVETRGTLQLPVADDFGDVGALFGDRTRLRVWWRGEDQWRVDRLLTAGETDLVHRSGVTVEWSYERHEARVSTDPDIRLPRPADLLPAVLAGRLLRDVDPGQVTRLPSARVVGVSAPGLRVAPAAPQSSIDHVDLWADPRTGVPLRLEVHADSDDAPAFVSELRSYSAATPSVAATSFTGAPGVEFTRDRVLDIADAANQYAPLRPPATVAGLSQSDASDGAVGVYGVGAAELIAIPLRSREADPLREQVRRTPGASTGASGVVVMAGPLGVLVTGEDGDRGWVVTGTVTRETLLRAAADLERGTTYVGERR